MADELEDLTDEMKAAVGQETGRSTYEVTTQGIRTFARAVGYKDAKYFDEDAAKAFYIDFLEFQIDWEHRFGDDFPLYLHVSKSDCVLHLTGHHGDCRPGAAVPHADPRARRLR